MWEGVLPTAGMCPGSLVNVETGAARGFRVPGRLVQRIVFMHVDMSLILSASRSLSPSSELPRYLQALFFVLLDYLKRPDEVPRPNLTKPFVHRNS